MTYSEFIEKFERCNYNDKSIDTRGLCRHHIEPKTVQKRKYGEVINDECVIVSYQDHVRCHYYYWLEHKEDYLHASALCMMINVATDGLYKLEDEEINRIIEEVKTINYWTDDNRKDMSNKIKKYFESEENRKKLSDSLKGDKNPNFGKPHSEEWNRKISEAQKGIPRSKASEETKRKLSEMRKGEKCYWYGKKYSDEHRKNLSISHSKKPFIMYKEDFKINFLNRKQCEEWLRNNGVPKADVNSISRALSGEKDSAYGYKFKYIDKAECTGEYKVIEYGKIQ